MENKKIKQFLEFLDERYRFASSSQSKNAYHIVMLNFIKHFKVKKKNEA